ncbi:MAG: VCBS repeat-containing protein [Deltaproteobacteria bacterium]|nr:VCBS repeat-containing protein [Deltaproteobacteria bacterium]
MRTARISALVAVILSAPAAHGRMARVDLALPGRVEAVWPGDVDGDGQTDLLVFWRQGLPPSSVGRISLYMARQGRIQSHPRQVLRIPERSMAYDTGDVDGDGRTDVLLLMHDGLWLLAGGSDARLAEAPRQVVRVMTAAAFPQEDRVPPMRLLLHVDGRRRLLVPTVPMGPLALYAPSSDGRGWQRQQVLRVPTRAGLYTSEEDHRYNRDFAATFRFTYPRLCVADCDADGRQDLFFLRDDAVAVFCARPDGSFAQEPDIYRSFGLLDGQERIQAGALVRGEVADFDADGRADLLFAKTIGGISNMRSEIRVFRNRRSGFSARPERLLRCRGYGASSRVVDVDGDGRPDLVRPCVEVDIVMMTRVLLSGRIDVPFHVHRSAGQGLLPARPDFAIESTLGVNFRSAQEMTGLYPVLDRDFDGDGRRDAVLSFAGAGRSADAPDRMSVLLGDGRGKYAEAWSQDLHATRFVLPFRLRPDDRPGLIVYFSLVEGHRGDVWVLHNDGDWRR